MITDLTMMIRLKLITTKCLFKINLFAHCRTALSMQLGPQISLPTMESQLIIQEPHFTQTSTLIIPGLMRSCINCKKINGSILTLERLWSNGIFTALGQILTSFLCSQSKIMEMESSKGHTSSFLSMQLQKVKTKLLRSTLSSSLLCYA